MATSDSKTLAQLEEEGKAKKYVTLETGSKISGYTRDYLERLCRLNKVDYRIWNNGQFVIELESLLKETQAMLLSYEGINFIDHKELTDPTPQFVANILSPIFANQKTPMSVMFRSTPVVASSPAVPMFAGLSAVGAGEETMPPPAISITGTSVTAGHDSEKVSATESARPASPSSSAYDAWDHALLAAHEEEERRLLAANAKPSPADQPSAYRPIVTEIDASLHHDTAPLFPPLEKNGPVISLAGTVRGNGERASSSVVPLPPGPEEHHSVHLSFDKSGEGRVVSESYRPPDGSAAVQPERPRDVVAPNVAAAMPPALTRSLVSDTPALPVSVIPQRPVPASAMPETLSTASSPSPASSYPVFAHSENAPTGSAVPAFPVSMPVPQAPSRMIRGRGTLSELRVMPDVARTTTGLPAVSGERHLVLPERHPLLTNTGFNLAFGGIIAVLGLFTAGMYAPDSLQKFVAGTPEIYVAGAGAAGSQNSSSATSRDSRSLYPGRDAILDDPLLLPFSDDVVVAEGNAPNSIIVQPEFNNAAGRAAEYTVDMTRGLIAN